MNRHRQLSLQACLVASFLASVAHADTITLKNAVRLPAGASAVTLADIAQIDGPDAQQFAGLAIVSLTGSTAAMEITVQDIRNKLTDAGVHWGRVSLSGRSVTVRPGRGGDANPPLAMAAVSIVQPATHRAAAASEGETFAGNELVHEPTLRGEIARVLLNSMRTPSADVRLIFDAGDAEILSTPINAPGQNVRYEIQPLGTTTGDRIPVNIRPWTDGKAGERRTVNVQTQIRVKAASLKHDVAKDEAINADDPESKELWLPPSQAAQTITVAQAAGGIAVRGMKTGEVLRESHLRREAMIKRGDNVMVRCLVGGVVISMQAEARTDGATGEIIELRKPGERETFNAKVTGRSEAVIDLSRS